MAAGVFVVLAITAAIVMVRRKNKKNKKNKKNEKVSDKKSSENMDSTEEPVTLEKSDTQQPKPLKVLELANLQGIGSREEQQDSFGISKIERYEKEGVLAVLCDGMGGMAEGGMIASETSSAMIDFFPWEQDSNVTEWIKQHSGSVYRQFRGHGGTTLAAAKLKGNSLSFWCVGDSDLFLKRDEKLYSLNIKQEYKNDLILRSLSGAFPVEQAFSDPQSGALSEYIGKETVVVDYNRLPFSVQPGDTLMLCSDGVSDTLTLKQINEAMALSPQECCDKLEEKILEAQKQNQDNYTAIVLKYNGKGEKE